jgi:hypothetical protein
MRLTLATLLILLTGCATEHLPHTPAYPFGQEFNLQLGASARVDDRWVIEFSGVREDSRCPMNARCVWEGNARIMVRIQKLPQPTVPSGEFQPRNLELNTSERFDKKAALEGVVV